MTVELEHRVSLVDQLLAEQSKPGTAVSRFSDWHNEQAHQPPAQAKYYSKLIPLSKPLKGEQYAFEVNLDQCTGCKACVVACHSLNGLDDHESWRDMGALVGTQEKPYLQTVTTACHHCADPACSNGCPVLAYEKDEETGIVRHLDDQCIGCSYCILKCPYDVPKYNPKRGIVRKCDMCHQRLAVGEAPACVQSCPNEAIAIRIVKMEVVKENSMRDGISLLPDAFASSYTKPSTIYKTERPIPDSAQSQTSGKLELEEAHWPLAWMLVLTQLAAGLFIASSWMSAEPSAMTALNVSGFMVHSVGLVISVLHLGQPLRAWRAFLGWKRSWLSREIMAFGGFAKIAAVAAVWPWMPEIILKFTPPFLNQNIITIAAAISGLAGVFCSAMVYVDTRRPYWGRSMTFSKFVGSMLMLGATAGAAILTFIPNALTEFRLLASAACLLQTVIFLFEHWALQVAFKNGQHPWHRSSLKVLLLKSQAWGWRKALTPLSLISWTISLMSGGIVATAFAITALLSTFASLMIERHLFFVCVTAPRMPGVPMPPPHH